MTSGFSSEDGKGARIEASLQRDVVWAVFTELVGPRFQEDVSFLVKKENVPVDRYRDFKRKGKYIYTWDGAVTLYADSEKV